LLDAAADWRTVRGWAWSPGTTPVEAGLAAWIHCPTGRRPPESSMLLNGHRTDRGGRNGRPWQSVGELPPPGASRPPHICLGGTTVAAAGSGHRPDHPRRRHQSEPCGPQPRSRTSRRGGDWGRAAGLLSTAVRSSVASKLPSLACQRAQYPVAVDACYQIQRLWARHCGPSMSAADRR